jgi:hypothetical protein
MEKWLIGVLVTIVSALFSTIGLLMQKYAHMKEAELMKKSGGTKGYFKCCGIPCNAWFVSGFVVLAFVPLPLDFIALSNAGQSLIIPVVGFFLPSQRLFQVNTFLTIFHFRYATLNRALA